MEILHWRSNGLERGVGHDICTLRGSGCILYQLEHDVLKCCFSFTSTLGPLHERGTKKSYLTISPGRARSVLRVILYLASYYVQASLRLTAAHGKWDKTR